MPYALSTDFSRSRIVLADTNGKSGSAFSLPEAMSLIEPLLTRKARNNGVGRHLKFVLATKGSCSAYFTGQEGKTGFVCRKAAVGGYEIVTDGPEPRMLLDRLNRLSNNGSAMKYSRRMSARHRAAGAATSHIRRTGNRVPTVAGDNGDYVRHYKNTPLSWHETMLIISRALRMRVQQVEDRLLGYMDLDGRVVQGSMAPHGAAIIRASGGFVVRVRLGCAYEGIISPAQIVELWSIKDNKSPYYRRLRKCLRRRRTTVAGSENLKAKERRARKRMKLIKRYQYAA